MALSRKGTHTVNRDTDTSDRLREQADNGPKAGEYEAAEAFIAECKRLTALARNHIRPRATTPAKAQMIQWIKPQTVDS
jgi:hypothetical protein